MALFRKKASLPAQEEALPGRSAPLKVPETHFVNGHRIAPPFPAGLREVVFGLGCFWGAERLFWQLPGVYSTAVGYAGGPTPNPTYEEVCSRPHRPHRSRARHLRPRKDRLRGPPQGVLGEPRPDTGHAPG